MNLDLDISHYNLDDILNLFHIPMSFDENDLKTAKSIVLKTHPDKSKLDPKYFLFYSKAYKILFSLWEFRKRGDINAEKKKNTDFVNLDLMESKKETLDQYLHKNKLKPGTNDFNKWFNEQFEKTKVTTVDEENGYEDWLRNSNKNETMDTKVTMATMGEEFERRKEKVKSMTVYKGVQEVMMGNHFGMSELANDAPGTYDSGLFSSLAYQDLQKAHEESIIPITNRDYEEREKFASVNEYVIHRDSQMTNPLSEEEADKYFKMRDRNDEELSVRRAFDLAKQTEIVKKKQEDFWKSIQLLK